MGLFTFPFFQRKSDKRTAEVGKISLEADEKKLWEQAIFHDGTDKFCRPRKSSQHRIIASEKREHLSSLLLHKVVSRSSSETQRKDKTRRRDKTHQSVPWYTHPLHTKQHAHARSDFLQSLLLYLRKWTKCSASLENGYDLGQRFTYRWGI